MVQKKEDNLMSFTKLDQAHAFWHHLTAASYAVCFHGSDICFNIQISVTDYLYKYSMVLPGMNMFKHLLLHFGTFQIVFRYRMYINICISIGGLAHVHLHLSLSGD